MQTTECYIDITVADKSHRITIKHNELPCDAEILVDDLKIEPSAKIVADGGCLRFDVDGHKVAILILNNKGVFQYDCFLDDVSVQSGMPWKLKKAELPTVLKWRKNHPASKARFLVTEILKGAIVGCVIFFLLFLCQYIIPKMAGTVSYLYLLISVVLPSLFFACLAPSEYKNNEEALAEYNRYSIPEEAAAPAKAVSAQPEPEAPAAEIPAQPQAKPQEADPQSPADND